MISCRQEPLFMIMDEVRDLLDLHYQELCLNKDRVKLAPMWEKYAALEQAGCFVAYTVRNDGVLVGYSGFFIQPHMHYSGLMTAINDVLFVHPEARGRAGLQLVKFCESEIEKMKQSGTELKIVWRAKAGTVLESLLPKLKYQPEEIAFGKLL